MWDPSAIIALASILGAVVLGGILSFMAIRGNKKINASILKLVIAIPALLLITGLKVYAQIGSDALTFVFGAIVGYIFGGQALQSEAQSPSSESDTKTV